MKSFVDFLAESEEEFEYFLYSVINMHTTDMIKNIGYALKPYGLVHVEPMGIQTNTDINMEFTDYPFESRFVTKLIMTNPISSRHAEMAIAVYTSTSDKGFNLVTSDGSPIEVSDVKAGELTGFTEEESQPLVGDKRVSTLMDQFRTLTSSNVEEIPVSILEGFITNHAQINKGLGIKTRKGFYMVETYTNGKTIITGPFINQPSNYEFGVMPAAKLIETKVGNSHTKYIVEVEREIIDFSDNDDTAEVDITDQDTGKVYTVVVNTKDNINGRQQAIELLSRKLGMTKTRLIPTKPEE